MGFQKGNNLRKGKQHSEETIRKMRGKQLSKETKQKLSEAMKGNVPWNKGKKCPQLSGENNHFFGKRLSHWKGKSFSEEHRKNISKGHKGQDPWNRGNGIDPKEKRIRRSIEYHLWREAVFARDNYTCQECGERGRQSIEAHHVKSFAKHPELRLAIDNGITLCKKCHKRGPGTY